MSSKLTYETLNAYNVAALRLDPLKRCSHLNKVTKVDPKTMCLISSSQEMTMFGHREDKVIAVTWIWLIPRTLSI